MSSSFKLNSINKSKLLLACCMSLLVICLSTHNDYTNSFANAANVQKFLPNGRFGRRSDTSLLPTASRNELGKLRFNPMENEMQQQIPTQLAAELAKTMDCVYSGVSSLFWCSMPLAGNGHASGSSSLATGSSL